MLILPGGILSPMVSYSLYLHIPFCEPGCRTCGCVKGASRDVLRDYGSALLRELVSISRAAPRPLSIETVYIGGENPNLLPLSQLKEILEAVGRLFSLREGAEISLQVVPGADCAADYETLGDAGVNRVSIRMDAAFKGDLQLLGRPFRFEDVIQTVAWASSAGIDHTNLDVMFGLPGQRGNNWKRVLELVLALDPAHISAYSFTPEPGTDLGYWMERGMLSADHPERAVEMYEQAMARFQAAGYGHYEISSWAKSGYLCRHNLRYWRQGPYLGVGAGAHGLVDGKRTENIDSPREYIKAILGDGEGGEFPRTPATRQVQVLTRERAMRDMVFMGLHLLEEGVSRQEFFVRFGDDLAEVMGEALDPSLREGLLAWEGDRLKLTRKGLGHTRRVFNRLMVDGKTN